MTYEEHPLKILDLKQHVLRTRVFSFVKVQWRNHPIEEATWEQEEEMKEKYHQLFETQAQNLFNDMPRENVIACNSIIHGYVQNRCAREAVKLFKELNSDPFERFHDGMFILATIIGACADLATR
ncbi:hypothetical protein LWI29_003854 [Acer saccharum]|uniref:Chromo domain-containing protein n=1 Tax=Acer saccharum TaxID=4024 RepID=A0AA39S1A1_ACESA|nr:hypothetical protein LWI29_003854 [Acer saccharum]